MEGLWKTVQLFYEMAIAPVLEGNLTDSRQYSKTALNPSEIRTLDESC